MPKSTSKLDAQPAHDPLDAVPIVAPGVEARVDENGIVQLMQKRMLGRGLVGRMCTKLGLTPDRRINLDERASKFWAQVDGERNLHAVAAEMAERFSLSPSDARSLTVQFTRDLMIRDLIVLRIPQPVDRRAPEPARETVNQP
jgi:hypothetical protein